MSCIIIPPKAPDPPKRGKLDRFADMILEKRVGKEVKSTLDTPLPAVIPGVTPALQALIVIGTIVAFNGAMLTLVNQIRLEFLELITTMPNFEFAVNEDGQETGNFSFVLYSLLREAALYFFIFVFMIFGILLMLKQAELVTTETLKNMLKTSLFGIIIIMIFPYIWDPISDISESSAVWILNPLYTGDPDNPCITESDSYIVAELYSHHRNMSKFASVGGIYADDEPCNPDLRINYLFAKAVFGAAEDIKVESEWWNFIDTINAWFQSGTETIFSAIFLSVTKVSILFFLTTFAALLGSVRQLLTDVIAISLPLLLVFRSLPFWGIDKMANTLLTIFVPLIFVPFFTALIITAGSTSLMTQEINLTTITEEERASGVLDTLARDRYMFWLYAIATLTLAVMTPVLFVPMLSSVASTIGRMVQTGVQAGAMTMAGVTAGAAGGAVSAAKGMAAGGAIGGATLASTIASRGGMGAMIKGMAQGMVVEGSHGKITPGLGSSGGHGGSSVGGVPGAPGYDTGYQLARQRGIDAEAARRAEYGGVYTGAGGRPVPDSHGAAPFVVPGTSPSVTPGSGKPGTPDLHRYGFPGSGESEYMPSVSYAPLGTSSEGMESKRLLGNTGIHSPAFLIRGNTPGAMPKADPLREWQADTMDYADVQKRLYKEPTVEERWLREGSNFAQYQKAEMKKLDPEDTWFKETSAFAQFQKHEGGNGGQNRSSEYKGDEEKKNKLKK